MRTFLFFCFFFILLLTIYRRIIEPFLEGLRGIRKPYNEPSIKHEETRHGLPKDKEIKDAEFEEIK
jgi:hypothetical protein